MKLEPKVIKNETLAIATRLITKLNISNGRVNTGTLIEDGVFKDLFTSSLNENFDVIIQELTPLVDKIVAKILKKFLNVFLSNYTEKQLFF